MNLRHLMSALLLAAQGCTLALPTGTRTPSPQEPGQRSQKESSSAILAASGPSSSSSSSSSSSDDSASEVSVAGQQGGVSGRRKSRQGGRTGPRRKPVDTRSGAQKTAVRTDVSDVGAALVSHKRQGRRPGKARRSGNRRKAGKRQRHSRRCRKKGRKGRGRKRKCHKKPGSRRRHRKGKKSRKAKKGDHRSPRRRKRLNDFREKMEEVVEGDKADKMGEEENKGRSLSRVVLEDFADAVSIGSRQSDKPRRGSRSGLAPKDLFTGLMAGEPLTEMHLEVEAAVTDGEEVAVARTEPSH